MPTIYFMHGFVAYGKSTFAKKLSEELKIPRISMDDIYIELHDGKSSIGIDRQEKKELLEIAWVRIADIVKNGHDVIFDSGSWTRKNRDANREKAKSLGADYKFYSIKCSPETAMERLKNRNDKYPEYIYPLEKFAEKLKYFEIMQEDEDYIQVDCN